jgi:cytochrome c-type biogenesis protein
MELQADSLSYASAFLGGIVVSFSPCVYPLIPITLSFIGVKAQASRSRGLFLSLVYVLGLAVTYSILGFVAAATGSLFGRIANHPIASLIVGNACILTGLSFFDVININFYGLNLGNKIKSKSGFISAFILGLISGLAVTPCTAPVLGTILVYVASKQNIIYGISLLFVFAYGMGFLLILLGTFGALLVKLPKYEARFSLIRKLCGFIFILIGEFFIFKSGRALW